MLKPVKLLICCLALLAFFGLYTASAQTVLTVREAEFRSRWAGPQEDRDVKSQFFEPDGGLTEKDVGVDPSEQTSPSLSENMDRLADNFRNRLRFGPLEFSLGLSSGWEYSSQSSSGESSSSSGQSSLYSSPTLAIRYEREIGLWTVATRFSSGYTHYFNQDYTAAGEGGQRNPISMTSSINIGYNSTRLTLSLSASTSTGSGFDITTGSNNKQTTTSTSFSARYIINDAITATGGIKKNGSGPATLAGSNTYSGTTTVSLGTLVVSNSPLTATILPASTTVNFTAPPAAGTYPVLSGPVGSASLTSITVNNLGGKTATVANSPNLVVQVTDAPTGPTFDSLYTPGSENGFGSNGLQNLMNYALGGTGPSSNPALPVLTSSASSLTLTANIRNSGQGVNVVGQYAYDLAGPWNDVDLTPTMASSSVANTTVQYFSQPVESNKPRKFLRFKVTKQ